MAHKLALYKNGKMTDISPIVTSINWDSNVDQLGDEINFSIAANDDNYFPVNPLEVGDIILLINDDNVELFRGIIITDDRNGRFIKKYTCFDNAFYLNKSKTYIQFNKIRADEAIKTLLQKVKVPYGNIANNNTIIDYIYNGKTPSDIIKDILQESENQFGKKYRMEMREGKLQIDAQEDWVVSGIFKLSDNVTEYDVFSIIENPNRKISIENMRNSVLVTQNDKILIQVDNQDFIDQFGLLQEVESIGKEDIAFAKNIANNKLKELAKVFEDNSIEVMGNDKFKAGRIVTFEEPITGMSGKYLIKQASHKFENGLHRMSLSLGVL